MKKFEWRVSPADEGYELYYGDTLVARVSYIGGMWAGEVLDRAGHVVRRITRASKESVRLAVQRLVLEYGEP